MIHECLESITLFDFIKLTLSRSKFTSQAIQELSERLQPRHQKNEGWVYNIKIKINRGNPPIALYIEGASIPGSTGEEFLDCYLEIVQMCRKIFWLPQQEIMPAMVESIDTKHWVNLDQIRDAIIFWRVENGI
jgi:hypothetical protein